MVPRGLRLRKLPTTVYSDQFKQDWNHTLSDCSLQLIRLITAKEEKLLQELRADIKDIQNKLQTFIAVPSFMQFDAKMKENLAKLEAAITET